jgi:hypothetical protein
LTTKPAAGALARDVVDLDPRRSPVCARTCRSLPPHRCAALDRLRKVLDGLRNWFDRASNRACDDVAQFGR